MLTRDKNDKKETLLSSKEHNPPSLPLNIRLKGAAEELEEEWTPEVAWGELSHRVESELLEHILRFKLTLTERPYLEWTWHDEPNRGGKECTILAHIHTGTNRVSVQKRKHLHWMDLTLTPSLSNESELTIVAHSLLRGLEVPDIARHIPKNKPLSSQASPQAARKKKRFARLDMTALTNTATDSPATNQGARSEREDGDKLHPTDVASQPGSTSHPATRNRLTYA